MSRAEETLVSDQMTPPEPRGLKAIAVILGLLAVAAVALAAVDQGLAHEAGRSSEKRDALEVSALGLGSGIAAGGQFRCTEWLAQQELVLYKQYRDAVVAANGPSELNTSIAYLNQIGAAKEEQISALLDRPLHTHLALNRSAMKAASEASCTIESGLQQRAEAFALVRRQNAAAARAADIGRARDRIPQALALFGVAGAVFAFAQQSESRRGRSLSALGGSIVVAFGLALSVLAIAAL